VATVEVITQYPTLEFLGGTQTQDVIACGYRTVAHGVYFEIRIPRKGFEQANVRGNGEVFAASIEDAFANPNVIGAEWQQLPNSAGELLDYINYTVSSDSGNSTAQIAFTYAQLAPGIYDAPITALANTLTGNEG